ncbi:MAG TPA: SPFH domain-containing protein [Anaeromyxobacteraceae bacterium]|nr:SPFH domain-containing protein [Anaeromyxobacteraceae bacterium]
MVREKVRSSVSGWSAAALLIPLALLGLGALVAGAEAGAGPVVFFGVVALLGAALGFAGLFVVNPNEAKVLQLFGDYVGSVREPGFAWANPLYTKKRVSLRVVSMEVGKLKVNDLDGNPVEIAAIVVWKVVDSAQAVFEVDHYPEYVRVQSEAAVRTLASRYPYDAHDDAVVSLRGNTQQVAEHLQKEIEERVHLAGVRLLEARISHLAYAPEIAQAMLQRQQAGAIIAARQKIVDGAVGMVEMALDRLARNQVVVLDEERKAAMVSNLLVVLCSERGTQPIVNTGTIYQ